MDKRMGATYQSHRAKVLPWFGELLSKIHQRVFLHSRPLDGHAEKGANVGLDDKVSRGVREAKEGRHGETSLSSS